MLASITPDSATALAQRIGFPPEATPFVLPPLIILSAFILGRLLEWLLVRILPLATRRTRVRLDDLLAEALHGPVQLFTTLTGVGLAILTIPLPEVIHTWTRRVLGLLLGAALVVIAGRLAGSIVQTYGERARLEGPARNLTRRLAVLGAWLVGALLVLDNQGVSITPLLTTLGLAGLAVALAFQDTLSNLFAGVYVQADRPLDVGHYVRIEDLQVEGYVVDVGWRTTKIRTLGNNLVVIPNARVASSVVTDYDLPEPRMSLLVRIPLALGVDPAKAESIILDEARRLAGTIPGFLEEPAPFVRFIPGFTESGLEFTLICQVEKFVDQYAAQHELRHGITSRLAKEGIGIATPYRTLRIEMPEQDAVKAP